MSKTRTTRSSFDSGQVDEQRADGRPHSLVVERPSSLLPGEVSAEQVLMQLRAVAAGVIGPADWQAHYDLAMAYREMGEYDDALRELALASVDPSREAACRWVTGLIELELSGAEPPPWIGPALDFDLEDDLDLDAIWG